MRSYEAARTYFSILGFFSWAVIVLGGLVALISIAAVGEMSRSFGGSSAAGLAGIVPGVAIAFAGFMGLVVVQIGRAGVDTAEYTQQMLKIARDQLEVSRQGLSRGQTQPQSFSSKVDAPKDRPVSGYSKQSSIASGGGGHWRSSIEILGGGDPAKRDELIRGRGTGTLQYMGEQIKVREGQFHFNAKAFVSLERAVKHIDQERLDQSAIPLPGAYDPQKT